jgi:hypothetical protein
MTNKFTNTEPRHHWETGRSIRTPTTPTVSIMGVSTSTLTWSGETVLTIGVSAKFDMPHIPLDHKRRTMMNK